MPKKSCVSPLLITRYTNFFLIYSRISVTTFGSTCHILLSSTYHTMVHCFPSIILLAVHISYVLILNFKYVKVFAEKLYHNRAYSMHPYIYLGKFTYRTFSILILNQRFVVMIDLTHDTHKLISDAYQYSFVCWYLILELIS